MSLDIEATTKGDAAHFKLNGSLDSNTAPQLKSAISGMDESIRLVAFDMQDLEFISSAGLRVIFSTLKQQKKKGGRVALSNMGPGVKKVFEIVKALPDFSVFANTQELDDYLAKFQR